MATNLTKASGSELLEMLQMAEIVLSYYDNEARANINDVNGEGKTAYANAANKILKYTKIKNSIFNEIEKRIDELC